MMNYHSSNTWFVRILFLFLLLQNLIPSTHSFMVVVPKTFNSYGTASPLNYHHHHVLTSRTTQHSLVPELQSFMVALDDTITTTKTTTTTGQDQAAATALTEQQPFTDTIDIVGTDGLIPTMVGVFGIVVLILTGLKVLSDKMDSAIEKVVLDFETTMKTRYPTRWQTLVSENNVPESDATTSSTDEKQKVRTQQIMNIMEQLQKDDPEFMEQVNKQML